MCHSDFIQGISKYSFTIYLEYNITSLNQRESTLYDISESLTLVKKLCSKNYDKKFGYCQATEYLAL